MPLAHPAITLYSGQAVTVEQAQAPVVVSCVASPPPPAAASAGASTPVTQSGRGGVAGGASFCYCQSRVVGASQEYHLTKVVVSENGARTEVELKVYDRRKQCDDAVASYPACR